MMRWNSFARSALFAAVAGGGVIPWLLVTAPLTGVRGALSFYLVIAVTLYVIGIGPSVSRGLQASLLVGVLGLGLWMATSGPAELALGLGVLLAVARSGLLYRSRLVRMLGMEVGLIAGGLLFARFLATGSLLSVMLALWGFLLVQSAFFLASGVRARPPAADYKDPFEAACDRATALLEGLP